MTTAGFFTLVYARIQSIILDGTAEPVSRDQILGLERGQGKIIFPIQLTTNMIGNLTRLILTFAICDDHTYIYILYTLPKMKQWYSSQEAE